VQYLFLIATTSKTLFKRFDVCVLRLHCRYVTQARHPLLSAYTAPVNANNCSIYLYTTKPS